MKKKILILFSIILVAGFLRFFQLGANPPSLTWDEAALGYNAYSLGIDGKDEFGRFLPHDYLESFGDFKPPVYAYLDIIPIKLFGLSEFSVRFPSALLGVLTVLITYFLTKRIFWQSKSKESYALFATLFLAVSPWHIMLSRAAFEANVATFFITAGVLLFLAGIQNKKWYLLLCAISFVFSIYTFNTARIVTPLLLLVLATSFRKELLRIKKQTIFAVILGILLLLPTVKFLLSSQASLRFKEVNIFSDSSVIKNINQEILNDNNAFWSKIIHNRRLAFGVLYLRHYLDNINPDFLFIKGDGNPKFSTQTVGQMYLWDLPFFITGFFILLRKKEGYWWFIPLWLLIGIIPAGTARETPHALRIETVLPTFQIITAAGVVTFLLLIKNLSLERYFKFLIIFLVFFALFFNFLYFYHDYNAHYAREFSGEWQYGYKQSIDYVKSVESNYDYIQITNALGRPYIYYLFYTKTNPDYFRRTARVQRDAFGFVTVRGFGKYIFPEDYNYSLSKSKKILYVNTPFSLPKNIKILKTINLLNEQPALVVYTYD
ncbi:glycosyltransferase family 39 protein [Patescibacteria group bacterium]|nr:glycosyltransferase family 39 protein [Patescibacteria group bacterium]